MTSTRASRRPRRPRLAVLLACAVVATTGCSTAPPSGPIGGPSLGPSDAPAPVVASARDGPFSLELRAPHPRWKAGQPIDVGVRLAYDGPGSEVTVHGSGSGLVLPSLRQLDGRLNMGASGQADCVPYTLQRGQNEIAFAHSIVYPGDDPDAAIYQAYAADPLLHLPAGTWRITASSGFNEGPGCGGTWRKLTAEITIVVDP